MAQIDIQGLFKDVLPNAAIEDKAEGLRQAELLGTLGGMAAYFGPQRERQLRRAAGGLFGVDLRSEKEQLTERLRQMETPKTEQEHQAYANLLDKIQTGAGLQYQMARAQEKRAERQLRVNERQIEAQEARDRQARIEGNERMRVDAMTLVQNLENDRRPQIERVGDRVVAISFDENNNPVTEELYDGTGSLNSNQVAALTTAASLQYADNPEGFAAITANILSGNITDAKDFEDYVPKAERGGFVGTMRNADIDNATASSAAVSGFQEARGALDTMTSLGILNSDGTLNEEVTQYNRFGRLGGGVVTATIEDVFNFVPNGRDQLSYLRTSFTKAKNMEIVNSLPPGVASDRDIMLFAEGFPPDNASADEIARYFRGAEKAYSLAADYARLKDSMWTKQRNRGENASMEGIPASWQRYSQAMERGTIQGFIDAASDEDLPDVLEAIKLEYGVVPFQYQGILRN